VADFALREPDHAATMNTAIPVLMYHLISEHEARFAVTPDELNEQMAWLRDNGYTSLTPSDVLKAVTEGIPLPDKPIMITVDDGYASDLLFAEIVTSYGFRPVFFWPNYADLTPDDMRWLASLGEACGHTVSHARLREMGWTAQLDEIGPNKDWIEGILGYPINCFAYPFGSYDQTSTDVVAYVGYQIAFDAWGMRSVVGSLDPYHISRKEIDGDFDLATFQAILAGGAQ
jgi:peptidoglycan/xylan/chitin deacetylase (PgdA/CDA1 family)